MAFDLASLMSGGMGGQGFGGMGRPMPGGFGMGRSPSFMGGSPGFMGGGGGMAFGQKPPMPMGPQTQPGPPNPSMMGPQGPQGPQMPQNRWLTGIDRTMGPPPMPAPMPTNLATLPARMPTPQGQAFMPRRMY